MKIRIDLDSKGTNEMKFMKKNVWLMLLSLSVMSAAGCGLIPTPEPTSTETPVVDTATPTVLPSPVTFVTSVPSSRAAAEGFLSAWESEDYNYEIGRASCRERV